MYLPLRILSSRRSTGIRFSCLVVAATVLIFQLVSGANYAILVSAQEKITDAVKCGAVLAYLLGPFFGLAALGRLALFDDQALCIHFEQIYF